MNYILASASPRRRELMRFISDSFKIVPSNEKEACDFSLSPPEIAEKLAKNKAAAVLNKENIDNDTIVIGCDTIVVLGRQIFGKPKDPADAAGTLRLLSGKTHEVITGVCLAGKKKTETFHVTTKVTFYPLSDREIADYVGSGEPFDKAGSYGIQQKGCLLVEKIEGDYYNVVGLPVSALARRLGTYQKSCKKIKNEFSFNFIENS